jgi:hypothetical protein
MPATPDTRFEVTVVGFEATGEVVHPEDGIVLEWQ